MEKQIAGLLRELFAFWGSFDLQQVASVRLGKTLPADGSTLAAEGDACIG